MGRIIFSDFDEFAEAINGISGRFVPTARSETDWWVQLAPVGRIAVQLAQIGGAATFVGDGTENSITLGVPVETPSLARVDGLSIQDNSFILSKSGQPFTFAAGQATRWAGIHIPFDHASLAPELLESLTARSRANKASTHTQTRLPYVTDTRLLISRLFINDGSVEFSDAAAAQSMEEEVMATVSRAIETSDAAELIRTGRPRFPRGRVVAKALKLIEENEGQPLHVQDLCRATQVSERTLRNIFQEYFGVGPMRLLKVNQLSEIRSALIAADPDTQTISSIVTRFGVWDFSSFARNYKALYRETASQTLRRAATHSREDAMHPTWIRFAARRFSELHQ